MVSCRRRDGHGGIVIGRINRKDVKGIVEHFRDLPDPRRRTNRRHLLVDGIVLSICGVLAGADGPTGIEAWARLHYSRLVKYLELPHGIPSHDTIGRVLQSLNRRAFQECFTAWLSALKENAGDDQQGGEVDHYAIDGKTLRRSHDGKRNLKPLHLVSVWATEQGVALGQISTGEKAGESRVIPHLIESVNVEGAVISIDAAGCQKHIARAIIEGGGDYVLALKEGCRRMAMLQQSPLGVGIGFRRD
ncbi:MAG: ISAs1 family transposase [Planctomycetota bacterium]